MTSRGLRRLAVWLLLAVLGCALVATSPTGTHAAAGWPIGLATGVLLDSPRRWRAATLLGVVVVGAVSFAPQAPVLATIGFTLALAVEAAVTAYVLDGGGRPRPTITGDAGLRFGLGVAGGSLVGAVLFALTALVAGYGDPWLVLLAVLVSHALSEVVFVAFYLRGRREASGESTPEVVLRWAGLAVVAALTLTPHWGSAVYLVLPLLAWSALRAAWTESLLLLLMVSTATSVVSDRGDGPFGSVTTDGLPRELTRLPQLSFVLGCALVVIPFAMAVNRQRTSRRAVEAERRRLARIVENATSMLIIEADADGRMSLFNPGAQRLLGYAEDEVLGDVPFRFHAPEEFARHAAELGVPDDPMDIVYAQSVAENPRRDWVFRHKDGTERTLSVALTPVMEDGEVVGYLCTGEDITDRVRTQVALETALAKEHDAVERLTELDRSKDVFVSNVSHELRTPISNIVGYLELLLDGSYGEPSGAQLSALRRVEGNSNRLLELVDDLLLLSRAESLELEPDWQSVDLRDVATGVMDDLAPEVDRRGHAVDLDLQPEPVVVRGDRVLLERLVGNLATNAVKFTPDGGSIVVRVGYDDEDVVLDVRDSGIGLSEREQGQLFNRFYRSPYAQEQAIQGSGLGLSIARSIAQLHGATISVTSRRDEGSLFRVTFDGDRGQRTIPTT